MTSLGAVSCTPESTEINAVSYALGSINAVSKRQHLFHGKRWSSISSEVSTLLLTNKDMLWSANKFLQEEDFNIAFLKVIFTKWSG